VKRHDGTRDAGSDTHLWMATMFRKFETPVTLRNELCSEGQALEKKWKRKKKRREKRRAVLTEMGSDRIAFIRSDEFLRSREWMESRYLILKRYRGECMLCKSRSLPLHVDHIKPRSQFPELALDTENLQVLCRECNLGKSWNHMDDWRNLSEI